MTNWFKAIVFDMGGVLLRTVDNSPREAMAQRFGTTRQELERMIFSSPTSIRSEVGEISEKEHWQEVLSTFGQEHLDVEEAYFEFFSGDQVDEELLNYAMGLKPNYKIGLLSNAWANTRRYVDEFYGFVGFFDTSIFSAEVKTRKPDAEIYLIMLNTMRVEAPRAIFIDDLIQNVAGARQVGMQAIHFQNTRQTMDDLDKLLKNE